MRNSADSRHAIQGRRAGERSVQASRAEPSRTFVLVHGAWHGGWCWTAVARQLADRGHRVHAPTLRGHGPDSPREGITLGDCVDSLVDYLDQHDLRDAILVGHSWGGFVVTCAAQRIEQRLARLIFWNALVPADGESMLDFSGSDGASAYRKMAAATADNSIMLRWDRFRASLMQEPPEEVAFLVYGLLTPVPFRSFSDSASVGPFADVDVPRSYIFGSRDLALPAELYDTFAKRVSPDRSVHLDGDHEALFTAPDRVATAILTASGLP